MVSQSFKTGGDVNRPGFCISKYHTRQNLSKNHGQYVSQPRLAENMEGFTRAPVHTARLTRATGSGVSLNRR